MRHSHIDANEIETAQKTQRGTQFIRPNVETRVLHFDLAGPEGRVLDLRGERMRDRIAENPEANRRIDIGSYFVPILQIRERVALGCLLRFVHAIALSGVDQSAEHDFRTKYWRRVMIAHLLIFQTKFFRIAKQLRIWRAVSIGFVSIVSLSFALIPVKPISSTC